MPDQRASQLSAAELVARLEQSRRSLMDAIAGLDEEGFRLRPREGEWTVAEGLAHLYANEQRLTEIARLALTEERPTVQSRGEAQREAEAKSAQRMPVPQIVHGLLAQRRDIVGLLEPLSAQQLGRSFRHERRGQLAVGWLFQRIAEHEDEHADQIRALRAQPAGRQA